MVFSSCKKTPEPPIVLDGNWATMAQPTFSARYNASCFTINDIAYVGMGEDNTGMKTDFYSFDGTTWTQIADFPGGGRIDNVAFTAAGKGYIGLGVKTEVSGQVVYDDLWEYRPSTNSWTQKASHPAGGLYGAAAFGVDGVGYIATGQNSNAMRLNEVWQYTPVNDQWTQKIDFPGGERVFAQSTNIIGKGFLIGGLGYSDIWEYDPILDVWLNRANFEGAERRGAALFTIGNKSYYGLGFEDGEYFTDLWEFDYHANMWTEQKSFEGTERSQMLSFGINEKGYILMGRGTLDTYSDFWQFTP